MTSLEIFAEDCGFPEGPIACDDGSVIFGELRTGTIIRARADGSKNTIATVKHGTSGLAIGPDGAIYVCNNGGATWGENTPTTNHPIGPHPEYTHGSIDRVDMSTGKVERLYDECDGVKLAGPNDIVFDDKGGFWFSDLGVDIGTTELHGGVYYAMADGSSIRRIAYAVGINGIGLSPDGSTVYGGASFHRTLLAFNAELGSKPATNFAYMSDGVQAEQGRAIVAGRPIVGFPPRHIPDSMAVEADGTVCQTLVFEGGGIARVNPETGEYSIVPFPDFLTTNLAFGGKDMRTAYVTLSSSGRIAKAQWPGAGLRLAYNI